MKDDKNNTGVDNTGYRNTGDWNNVDKEAGFFNTIQSKTIRVFNEDCDYEVWDNSDKPQFLYFDLTEWISLSDMTDEEKKENETHIATGGYLKSFEYKEAFKKSFDNRGDDELDQLKALPNFDADVFFEISGIDVRVDETKQNEIKLIREDIEKLSERLKELEG